MSAAMFKEMLGEALKETRDKGVLPAPPTIPNLAGAAFREPIFYGGESAYGFQYRDLAEKKYGADDAWLMTKMGFSIADARKVVAAIAAVQNRKVKVALESLHSMARQSRTMLPGFGFTAVEVAERANIALATIQHVLDAFTFA